MQVPCRVVRKCGARVVSDMLYYDPRTKKFSFANGNDTNKRSGLWFFVDPKNIISIVSAAPSPARGDIVRTPHGS